MFNFNFQTFTFQLSGKSKRFIFCESQINLKKVFSLILEEVRYGNIGDITRIINQNISNLKETQIIEYIKLCELEFFPNQQRFFGSNRKKIEFLNFYIDFFH